MLPRVTEPRPPTPDRLHSSSFLTSSPNVGRGYYTALEQTDLSSLPGAPLPGDCLPATRSVAPGRTPYFLYTLVFSAPFLVWTKMRWDVM